MTTKKAIQALYAQKRKLASNKVIEDSLWYRQTRDHINAFLPNHENLIYAGQGFHALSDPGYTSGVHHENHLKVVESQRQKLHLFLDACIETLKVVGVPKQPNWIFRIGTTWQTVIASALVTVIAGAFWIGFYFGQQKGKLDALTNPPAITNPDTNAKTTKVADTNQNKIRDHKLKKD